ncbi:MULTISPECIES: hypothetical protein [Flavobacterium]|uniref:Uncharacterized protein n=1 Tax=Flavobacterium jumunjinense TaxID=998845 RepID=A0ABV5GLU9_9FLAO|nr:MULTISPECIES: hypothetical protein [Flavobacterium]
MEKSIENIWKEGFQKDGALIAPRINNLYNQKSIHIIDKFKRMFRINLVAIVVFAFVFLILSYFLEIVLAGIIFFIMLMVLFIINKNLLNGLEKLDKKESSYEYLKSFNLWINKHKDINKKVSTFFYPLIFLAFVISFWFKEVRNKTIGEHFVNKVLIHFPDADLFYGIPVIAIVLVLFIAVLLGYFGGRIFQWDLNVIYGKVFKKLELLMNEIERLNK